MSSGLPLEILGVVGPILCWVEGVQRPGLPESWYSSNCSFEDRVRAWLMRDLPTYSFDTLDEIIRLARDRRRPCDFPLEPRRAKDRLSPMAPPEGFDLVYMFHRLFDRYLQWTGNELCIREGRIVELHELAMRFPVRHLIRYCHADAVVRGYISIRRALELPVQMSQLHITSQGLRTVVEQGVSEGHLHLNGVINADESWADHLLRRLTPGVKDSFTPEADRLLVLSRTAVRLLAIGVLYSFVMGCKKKLPFHLISLLDKMYRAGNPVENRFVEEELNSEYLIEVEKLQTCLSQNVSGGRREELEWLMSLVNSDIHCVLSGGNLAHYREGVSGEGGIRSRILLLERLHLAVQRILVEHNVRSTLYYPRLDPSRKGLNADRRWNPSPMREFMHQLFCRYLIYHTHHWQEATQSGRTTGLRNFQRFFGARQREPLKWESPEIQGFAVESLSQARPLCAVEGRLSPPSTGISAFIPWILAFANQVYLEQFEKFGIVVHFRKQDHKKNRRKDDSKTTLDLRHGKIRRRTQSDAFKLFRVLSIPNPVVPFIVGIDAANMELTTPPEVFAPAFRFLREYPIKFRRRTLIKEIFGKCNDIAALVENRRLGMTYHVGEDFRHLLSGLRAIHEVIEFFKPLPGDRLGHAIALALEPEVWAAQVGYQAVLPMQEWLDTLVWIHYLLGPGHDLIGLLGVEDQIQYYSRKIYGKSEPGGRNRRQKSEERDWMPITLYDSWRLRQIDPCGLDPSHLVNNKFRIRQRGQGAEHRRWAEVQTRVLNEVDQHVGTEAAYLLVKLYWYSPRVREIGDNIITIDMQDRKDLWLAVCREAQQNLQNLVRDRQLVVEVNPTSNRIIGPMDRIADHPIFKLTLDQQHHLAREIRVTINTDDPGIFATSLPHEFYLLGESLISRGVSEPEVVKWLNWLRKNGRDYSFLSVLPKAKDNRHMESVIEFLLKRYAPLLRRLRGERRKYESPECRMPLENTLRNLIKCRGGEPLLKKLLEEAERGQV